MLSSGENDRHFLRSALKKKVKGLCSKKFPSALSVTDRRKVKFCGTARRSIAFEMVCSPTANVTQCDL